MTDEAGRATTADFFRRPRLVWPSGGGTVEEVENGWRRLRSGVPDQVVASCRGRPALFWDRLERSPGRPSVVGTTARDPRAWPPHRAADEPQAQLRGENATVAVTAGGPCLGGIALSHTAGEVDLTAASGRFQDEAADVSAESTPETVNTDGGKATQAAGRTWFPKVAVIWCFRHGSWKIRDRGRTAFELPRTVWGVYRATSARLP